MRREEPGRNSSGEFPPCRGECRNALPRRLTPANAGRVPGTGGVADEVEASESPAVELFTNATNRASQMVAPQRSCPISSAGDSLPACADIP